MLRTATALTLLIALSANASGREIALGEKLSGPKTRIRASARFCTERASSFGGANAETRWENRSRAADFAAGKPNVDYGTAKRVDYSLDLLGNRVLEDVTTQPSTGLARSGGVFNNWNQLTSSTAPGSATTYQHDLNGNLLSETRTPTGLPAEVTSYTWTKDNRLSSVTPPTNSPATPTLYKYDPNGLRTERVDATGTRRYLLDGNSVLEELDGTNATAMRFFNNPEMIDEVLAYQRGAATEYPLTDALGSVYAATDSAGAVVHRYDFDVYGVRTDLGGTSPAIDNGYTGRRHDSNGFIENGSRQRRPQLGNWMQADRAGMIDGPNLYNYVGNQPTMATDPTGEMSTLVVYNSVLDDPKGVVQITETSVRRSSFEALAKKELAKKVFTDSSASEITMEPVGSMAEWRDVKQKYAVGDAGGRFSRIAFFIHGTHAVMSFGSPQIAVNAAMINEFTLAVGGQQTKSIGLLGCDTFGTQTKSPTLASGVREQFPNAAMTVVIGSWFLNYQPRPPTPTFTSLSLLILPASFPQ